MNDDALLTAVRETFAGVRMDTPPEQIVRRGHAVRARRRLPRVAGAVAAVAGTAVAVTALLPASHQPGAHLAAWTVARQGDDAILVTIRQLTDPVGLQRTLRADGVRATVTFDDQQNPACRNYSRPMAMPPCFGCSRRPAAICTPTSAGRADGWMTRVGAW